MHGAVSRRGADKKPVQKGRKGGIKGALALTTARTKTIGCEKRGPHGLVKRRVQIVANTAYGSETMSRSRGIEEGVAGRRTAATATTARGTTARGRQLPIGKVR